MVTTNIRLNPDKSASWEDNVSDGSWGTYIDIPLEVVEHLELGEAAYVKVTLSRVETLQK